MNTINFSETEKSYQTTKDQYWVKGNAFKNVQSYIDSILGEGTFDNHTAALGIFAGKFIVASKKYQAYDFVKVEKICADLLNIDLHKFCVDCTTYILTTDLNSVYRFFIGAGGPMRMMASVPRIANIYNSLFTYQVLQNDKGFHVIEATFPEGVSDWALGTIEGGVNGILQVCKHTLKSFKPVKKDRVMEGNETLLKVVIEVTY